MDIILVSYIFVIVGWFVLVGLVRYRPGSIPHLKRIMWLWFVASVILFIAFRLQSHWLGLGGILLALIGISHASPLMQQWLKRQVHALGLLVWLLWGGTLSLLLAQLFVLWLNNIR